MNIAGWELVEDLEQDRSEEMHVSGHECCFCKLQRSRNCIFYLCPFSPLLCACSNHMSTTSQKARLINTTESFILGGIAACIAVSIHPAQTVH